VFGGKHLSDLIDHFRNQGIRLLNRSSWIVYKLGLDFIPARAKML
jgi:hypothetical protein